MYADLHSDTFYKCFTDKISFSDTSLHINSQKLSELNCFRIQTFAHYIPEKIANKFDFFQKMLQNSLEIIRSSSELVLFESPADIEIAEKENKTLAILAIEGGDLFDSDIAARGAYLSSNHVKFISLCYNNGNELCSGAFSKVDNGVSAKGMEIASLLDRNGIILDISHLSEKSSSDLLDSDFRCIATHSNCSAILNHPRNISDDLINKLISQKSLIGLNLYKPFVGDDIIHHIEHIISLGGEASLALGADFDGCDEFCNGVSSVSDIPELLAQILSDKNLFYKNIKNYLKNI